MTIIDLHAARRSRTRRSLEADADGIVRWPLWRAVLLWVSASVLSWWGLIGGAAALVDVLFE